MFKVKNGEAAQLNSPVIKRLFNDDKRQFPTVDAFRLAELLQSITSRLGPYQDQLKKIIAKYNGTIKEDGKIFYKTPEDRDNAENEIKKLNDISVEYTGNKIKMSKEWPALSLQEANFLKCLIRR